MNGRFPGIFPTSEQTFPDLRISIPGLRIVLPSPSRARCHAPAIDGRFPRIENLFPG